MPRTLRERQFYALEAAAAGRLFRLRTTGRYAIRHGGREQTLTTAARSLAADGLITTEPLEETGLRINWDPVAVTDMGRVALDRERERHQAGTCVHAARGCVPSRAARPGGAR